MSGYLQRLAHSARNPGGGIRPLVASPYSSLKPEFPPPIHEEEIVVRSDSSTTGVSALTAGAAVSLPQSNAIEQLVASPTPPTAQPQVFEYTSTIRPQPTAQAEPKLTLPSFKSTIQRAHNSPSLPERESHLESESRIEGRPRLEAHLRTGLAAPQVPPLRPTPRTATRELHTPDEIQIHIGRIEVTAVPPAAPAPSVTRPRKSLDLGEYLKRGRGRQR